MDTTGNQLNTIKQNKTWNMAYIPAWWCETLYFTDWEFQVLLIYYTFHRNYNESHVCNHILWYRYFIHIMLNMCPPPFRMTVNLHIHTPWFSVQLTVSRDTIELHIQTHTSKVWHRKQHDTQLDAQSVLLNRYIGNSLPIHSRSVCEVRIFELQKWIRSNQFALVGYALKDTQL